MADKKKVLGISTGREGGNSEILLKQALRALQEEGVDVSFLRLKDYYIKPCEGCELCTFLLRTNQPSRCKFPWDADDYKKLMDTITDADGLIISAPAYNLMPPGYLTALLNRSHCIAIPWLPSRYRKVVATIAVGGSDWLSLQMPILNFVGTELLGSRMNLVDSLCVGGVPGKGMIALHQDYLDRAYQLGKNMFSELGAPVESGRCKYYGEHVGACPICHSDLLILRNGRVACGICDYMGDPVIKEGKIDHIKWDGGIELTRWSDMVNEAHAKGEHPVAETKENGQYALTKEEMETIAKLVKESNDFLSPIKP